MFFCRYIFRCGGGFSLFADKKEKSFLFFYPHTLTPSWISPATVRSVSLRLQNEGQKKLTDCTDAHGVFDTDFFDLCFLIYIWISYGFASVTACGCCDSDCRVICYYFAYIYCPKESKCRTLAKSVYNPPCPVKVQSKSK